MWLSKRGTYYFVKHVSTHFKESGLVYFYLKKKEKKKKIETGINLTFFFIFRLFRNECPFQNDLCTTFHKTEVLMVILRFLIGLNFDWFKSYDTKSKYFHFSFFVIMYKNRRLGPLPFLHFCVFCHNFCTH